MSRAIALFGAFILSAILAACGGGSSSSAGPQPMAKGWVSRADAICRSARDRIDPVAAEVAALRARPPKPTTLIEWAHLVKKYEVASESETAALEKVSVPRADRSEFHKYLMTVHTALRHGHQALDALENGAFSVMAKRSDQNKEMGIKAGEIAGHLGLRSCSGAR